MDIFYSVVVAGMAVAFMLSFIESLGEELVSSKVIRLILTWPLSFVAVAFLDILEPFTFVVAGTAAAFFALTSLRVVQKLLDRPTIVDRRRL